MGFKFRDVATFVLVALLFYFALTAQGENTSLEEDLLDQDDIYRTPHFYNDYDNYRDHYQVESDTPRPPYFMQRQNKTENTEYTEQPEGSAGREEQDSGTDADDCWLKLNAAEFFETMDNLDKEFEEVRRDYQLNVGESMDSQMMDELLSSRGAAHRAVHKAGGDSNQIPAGLNLGGYSMMRLEDSILFFHRMKLRNSTNFQVQYLHNDLKNMALIARIDLHDLHLLGSYERSATHKDPSILYYTPSYGALELLLKNVHYKMQARLRMMSDRVTIELINSELVVNDGILMTYNRNITNVPDPTVKVATLNLEDFLQRLKTDLDLWLKDYFNDYLMYFQLPDYDNSQFQEYENKKTILLNKFVHNAVNTIKKKIFNLGGHALKLPKFTIFSVPNMILKIENGVLRGMDSMYQRSVGTGMKNKTVRSVDVIVGFSRLRVEYKFETILPDGSPPLSGYLMMSADEMTAHMGISMVKDPESVDLNFDFIQQMKPESLTVEGPANRLIANFKHNLEYNIIAMMSNALMHNIKMLNTITRCVPFFYGHTDDGPNELPNKDEDINNL